VHLTSRRRRHFSLGLLCAWLYPGASRAQICCEFTPPRPVNLVVASPAGGADDVAGRILAARLEDGWKKPVQVVNAPGAGGMLAAERVAKSGDEAISLLSTSVFNLTVLPFLYERPRVQPAKDLVPVAQLARLPLALVAPANLPARSFAEFAANVRRGDREYNIASSGRGTISHFMAEQLKAGARLNLQHVPYKGTGSAVMALVEGQPDAALVPVPAAERLVREGRLRAFATTSRVAGLDAPTFEQVGVPGMTDSWYGVYTSRRADAKAVAAISNDLQWAAATEKGKLASLGLEIEPAGPQQFAQLNAREAQRWADVARLAKIRP
jgi:tripartite-type tricarboxylate transporter receptor subunit TctC